MCDSSTAFSPQQAVRATEQEKTDEVSGPEASILQARVTVPSRIRAINPAVKRLMKLLKNACAMSEHAFAVETALREALANAIVHGNHANPRKKVQVCWGCDAQGIHIVIADEGAGFDPATLPSPLAGANVNFDHGRGIFLINTLMDEVRFENGGREIHMRKRRAHSR